MRNEYNNPYTPNSGPAHEVRRPVSTTLPAVTRNWEEERRMLRAAQPPPRRRRGGFFRAVCLLLMAAIVGGATGAYVVQQAIADWEASASFVAPAQTEQPGTTPQQQVVSAPQPQPSPPAWTGGRLSAEEIYTLGRQQVVGITTEVVETNAFGQTSTSIITGSGFIISEDGYILTNYHVVESAARILVMMEDGAAHEAVLVGGENITSDVAVLKIEATGLSAARLGSSADMRVGSTIFAIGNPLGELTYTITGGLVSSLNREVSIEPGRTLNMFQIDAAVNSGNSGGPVYNEFGQVVGVVTAKTKLEGVEGIGFAIPIDAAMSYANQLMERGFISRPHLGILPVTVSYAHDPYTAVGVRVDVVHPGTAAERGGMLEGDIITAIDGREVTTVETLRAVLGDYAPGDLVTITVRRDGASVDLSLVLGERPEDGELTGQGERGEVE